MDRRRQRPLYGQVHGQVIGKIITTFINIYLRVVLCMMHYMCGLCYSVQCKVRKQQGVISVVQSHVSVMVGDHSFDAVVLLSRMDPAAATFPVAYTSQLFD